MKNNARLSGFALAMLVLQSIFVQSMHNVEHLAAFFVEEHCDHHYAEQDEIGHSHNDLEHCETCDFTFTTAFYSLGDPVRVSANAELPEYIIGLISGKPNFFSGSALLYRGPPSFVV